MDKFRTFSLLILLSISLSHANAESLYDNRDVKARSVNLPICGTGKCQSPVDLGPTSKVVLGLPIIFKNYSTKLRNAIIANTGHTVTVSGNWGNNVPTVTGSFINNTRYLLNTVHLHWSDEDYTGTEHTIYGRRYASEVHLVHYNSKYKSFQEATSESDGLLVVGVLFQVNPILPNRGFKMLASLANKVSKLNSVSTGLFDLGLFNIGLLTSFYSYAGSLTTPPYSENVHWVVSRRVLHTNSQTMSELRSVELSHHEEANARPVQPLNGREVILYKKYIISE